MPGRCACCSSAGYGLGKLMTGRMKRRDAEDELGHQFIWAQKGIDAIKDSAANFGNPNAGDPFTSAHLAEVQRGFPGAQAVYLASQGLILPSKASTLEWYQRWAAQTRYYAVPASLVVAVTPAPAPDGQGCLVNTVLGPVGSRTLGMTLPHEHCWVTSAGLPQIYPEMVPFEDYIIPEAVRSLQQLKEAGGGAIVDCTTFDLGRDAAQMRRISSESGIHIIATTGSWLDPSRSFHALDPDTLAEIYIRECTVGIQGTGIKAGIIKCAHETGATWDRGTGFSRMGEMTCRAVARAHKATGLPITTHTEVEEHIGMAQIALFQEEGVDLNRVYIGHCNDSTDLDYLTAMLKTGVWLGLDRTGPGMAEPGVTRPEWEERANTIKRLIDAGWGHKILLSHDWMVYMGFDGPDRGASTHREKNPPGWTFILQNVIPRVHKLGGTKEQTDKILYENPIRFFEGAA